MRTLPLPLVHANLACHRCATFHHFRSRSRARRGSPDAAPFAVNQIVHRAMVRLEQDLTLREKYKVSVVIASLDAQADVIESARGYG